MALEMLLDEVNAAILKWCNFIIENDDDYDDCINFRGHTALKKMR
jgi:hypothetical protein